MSAATDRGTRGGGLDGEGAGDPADRGAGGGSGRHRGRPETAPERGGPGRGSLDGPLPVRSKVLEKGAHASASLNWSPSGPDRTRGPRTRLLGAPERARGIPHAIIGPGEFGAPPKGRGASPMGARGPIQ